jgi:Immunity protein 26
VKKVKQKFIVGSIFKIPLENQRFAYGRILDEQIAVYDFINPINKDDPDLELITQQPVLFYVFIYHSVITEGYFEIIGFIKLTQEEIEKIPPYFNQDSININACVIFYQDARVPAYKANAQDCIGLENACLYDFKDIKKRIEDYYAGNKNNFVEYDKVILSTNDERYNDGYK